MSNKRRSRNKNIGLSLCRRFDEDFVDRSINERFRRLEPQWRFESRLPVALEGDENDKIELECSVQDEDAECDWYFAGEVSRSTNSNSFCSFVFFSFKENPSGIESGQIRSDFLWKSEKISRSKTESSH